MNERRTRYWMRFIIIVEIFTCESIISTITSGWIMFAPVRDGIYVFSFHPGAGLAFNVPSIQCSTAPEQNGMRFVGNDLVNAEKNVRKSFGSLRATRTKCISLGRGALLWPNWKLYHRQYMEMCRWFVFFRRFSAHACIEYLLAISRAKYLPCSAWYWIMSTPRVNKQITLTIWM